MTETSGGFCQAHLFRSVWPCWQALARRGFPGCVAGQVSGSSVAVSVKGPTRRSTPFASLSGRCAMKPRSAGHLER
jgi:hypothetical protein